MSKNLVIVESPAKSKTITKYLGKDFVVLASFGHVRDLLPKEGAVETQNDFKMHYEIIEKNAKHVDEIIKALKKVDTLYLATDPDREGEAIAWHIYEILQEKGALKNKSIFRVAFHEITKSAIQEAIKNPRAIDMSLVNAQQARRALDYLVGFNLSPLLWKKIRAGLSAGRVQSPALRLIAERELEIEKFETKEYWSVVAQCEKDSVFDAKLTVYQDKKVEQFTVVNKKQAADVKKKLLKEADGTLTVDKVEKKQRKRNPAAPFITSTLQQEASRKLGFTTQRTMRIAQQLYEGIDIGEGSAGLITYMRTDSVNLADEAIQEIRGFIADRFGKENVPATARKYRSKSKNAQEAHEAIRPTSILREPESIRHALSSDQFKLYNLIWKRTLACQMIHATMNTVAVDLLCGQKNYFRANGSTIVTPGFILVYQESLDDTKKQESDEKVLPPLSEGDVVDLRDILCEQHFTEPPPRYSEASLVKALEEYGIGRPSTYSSIISTLINREYATLEQKRFHLTDLGRVVNRFLTEYFTQYVDYDFTAHLEDDLDAIARGEKVWLPLLEMFWAPLFYMVNS
ncbi:MAG: type I DNA topoisomerase, partial [Gammaproteobacteria bacterium]|nr:type I DNA topoisomerase [Gammaproteobacteria bacterium]